MQNGFEQVKFSETEAIKNTIHTLDIFPSIKYIIIDDVETNINKLSCPICLKNIKRISKPNKCSHWFCANCLMKWTKMKKQCPCCRTPFTNIIQ